MYCTVSVDEDCEFGMFHLQAGDRVLVVDLPDDRLPPEKCWVRSPRYPRTTLAMSRENLCDEGPTP